VVQDRVVSHHASCDMYTRDWGSSYGTCSRSRIQKCSCIIYILLPYAFNAMLSIIFVSGVPDTESLNAFRYAEILYIAISSTCASIHPPHQTPSNLHVHHSTDAKRGHNPAYARDCALRPIPQYLCGPLPSAGVGSVVQIQAQQMKRRADQLYRCGCDELRRRRAAHILSDAVAHVCFEARRE
jgi:hypothetical protein